MWQGHRAETRLAGSRAVAGENEGGDLGLQSSYPCTLEPGLLRKNRVGQIFFVFAGPGLSKVLRRPTIER